MTYSAAVRSPDGHPLRSTLLTKEGLGEGQG